MSIALPDVNVLVAIAWPTHVHHDIARRWFAVAAPKGWATCALTLCGFVRVSANPTVVTDAVPQETFYRRGARTSLRSMF